MRKHNQFGIAALEIVLLLVIVAIIGFTGYKVLKGKQNVDNASQSAITTSESQPLPEKSSTAATPIKSANDLNSDLKALDRENPDDNSADANQLNTQTSDF